VLADFNPIYARFSGASFLPISLEFSLKANCTFTRSFSKWSALVSRRGLRLFCFPALRSQTDSRFVFAFEEEQDETQCTLTTRGHMILHKVLLRFLVASLVFLALSPIQASSYNREENRRHRRLSGEAKLGNSVALSADGIRQSSVDPTTAPL